MGPGRQRAMGGPMLKFKEHGGHQTTQHWHFCLLHKHWADGICPTAIDSPVPAPQGVTAMVATLVASHCAHGGFGRVPSLCVATLLYRILCCYCYI
mmetsp:Transcript_34036/g.61022  ORF Transcript_34036/g.61022 Transcript_34036/m.61022 type:complete len:96 (+) Transcript_34036:343-630(+)